MRTLAFGALAAAAHAAQFATFTPFVEIFPTAGCNTTSTAFDGAVSTAGESPLACRLPAAAHYSGLLTRTLRSIPTCVLAWRCSAP